MYNFQIEPYTMMYNSSYMSETSPEQSHYYGYMVDLLDQLGASINFRYILQPAPDGEFGYALNDGSGDWTGLVGDLIHKVRYSV